MSAVHKTADSCSSNVVVWFSMGQPTSIARCCTKIRQVFCQMCLMVKSSDGWTQPDKIQCHGKMVKVKVSLSTQ